MSTRSASPICVHEFSHGIMRGARYPGNTFNEYRATGIEAYTHASGRGPETLLEADPRLYELVRQVIASTKMPGNVYVGRSRGRSSR